MVVNFFFLVGWFLGVGGWVEDDEIFGNGDPGKDVSS